MTTAEHFEEFWRQYPRGRKQAKAEARRLFIKITTGKHKDLHATPEQLVAGALRYAAAMGDHHPYVKKPTTWLNGGCWEDEDLAPPEDTGNTGLRARPLEKALTDRSSAPASMPARVSTRGRSLYDDLTDRSWADGEE